MIEGTESNIKIFQEDINTIAVEAVDYIDISLEFLGRKLNLQAQEELFWCIVGLLEKHVENEGVYKCQM